MENYIEYVPGVFVKMLQSERGFMWRIADTPMEIAYTLNVNACKYSLQEAVEMFNHFKF